MSIAVRLCKKKLISLIRRGVCGGARITRKKRRGNKINHRKILLIGIFVLDLLHGVCEGFALEQRWILINVIIRAIIACLLCARGGNVNYESLSLSLLLTPNHS